MSHKKNSFTNDVNQYFEKKKKQFLKKFTIHDNYKHVFLKDNNDDPIIEIYDHNDEFVLRGHYEIIGSYYVDNSIWYWGWCLSLVDRKLLKSSKKIKKFHKYIAENYEKFDHREADDLYFKTKNGYFNTTTDNILYLVKLFLFITKGLWYFPICRGETTTFCYNLDKGKIYHHIKYIVIKDIVQIS